MMKEQTTGMVRNKLWRLRYVIVAGFLLVVLLSNHFALDQSISDLNPFPYPPELDHQKPAPAPTNPASPPKDTPTPSSAAPAGPPTSPVTFQLGNFDFNGQYVGWPLKRVCEETKWTPGLIFMCDNNSGGIGNIRNFILTCLRYAIDAGATAITMPQIQRRSESDLANIFTTGMQPFDYFFDEEHFRNSMQTYCPQMQIFNSRDDIPNQERINHLKEFYPKDLNTDDGCDGRGTNRHLDQFREKFDQWILDKSRWSSWEEPTTITFRWATFFEWNIIRDGPELANTFGDLLRINKKIEAIAITVIKELEKFAGAEASDKKITAPYLGVHLRTESDALGFWPNFDVQSDGYIKEAESRDIKHAYLACGDAADGHRFGQKAYERMGLNVTQKTDLLKGEELQALTDMSWDQQALVDYLVLSKSTHFTGCSFSSFSMNIAMKRHLLTGGLNSRPWKSPGDDYSTLVGRFENWYGDWMFMYDCMWP